MKAKISQNLGGEGGNEGMEIQILIGYLLLGFYLIVWCLLWFFEDEKGSTSSLPTKMLGLCGCTSIFSVRRER